MKIMDVVLLFLDFYLGWWFLYLVLKLIKVNTRAVQIVKGALLLCTLNFISKVLDLQIVNLLTGEVMTWAILAMIIIFQPEIRAGLEQIGRTSTFKSTDKNTSHDFVHLLTQTLKDFSREKVGALIVIEWNINLEEFIQTGTPVQAIITDELLKTIFMLKTPLHDGAVFIRHQKIWCAGAVLPVTNQDDLPQTIGTRHRAAIGISEVSDCIVLVVSEETGKMSIVQEGKMESFEKSFDFEKRLRKIMMVKTESESDNKNTSKEKISGDKHD